MLIRAHPLVPRHRRLSRSVTAGLAVVLALLVACSDGGEADTVDEREVTRADPETQGPDAAVEAPSAPDPPPDAGHADERPEAVAEDDRSIIAQAEVPVVRVHDVPEGEHVLHELTHPRPIGAPLTFLVDGRDGDWLEVLLPVRPNGSTGWIRADDVTLVATSYRVEVELSAHRLTIYLDDEVHLETAIGVGGDGTPTPPGRYYITELLRPPDPGGPYGPYAFGLSGFSEVHLDFAGGDGVIGIHGTSDPSSIGYDTSNGCIRVDNDVISEMATFLPLGAPVLIRA